jgi:hypothetical protein
MPKDTSSTLFERSKHPLVVLACATLLSSVLIPVVNSQISSRQRQADLRPSKALQALQSSSETERRINGLLTEVENIMKGEIGFDSQAQAAIRQRIYLLYAEFNRDAWWWHWQLLQEVRILRLVDEASAEAIRNANMQYNSNLQQTTQALDPLWGLLVSSGETSRPKDGRTIVASTRSIAESLRRDRQEIVARMIAPLLR